MMKIDTRVGDLPFPSPQKFWRQTELAFIQLVSTVGLANMFWNGYHRRGLQTVITGSTLGVLCIARDSIKKGMSAETFEETVDSLRSTVLWHQQELSMMVAISKKHTKDLENRLNHAKEEALNHLEGEHATLKGNVEDLRQETLELTQQREALETQCNLLKEQINRLKIITSSLKESAEDFTSLVARNRET